MGERQPLSVDADELVRECRSVQASNSSPPPPMTPPTPPTPRLPAFPAGLPCSGEPCMPGPAPRPRAPIPAPPGPPGTALFRLTRPRHLRYLVPFESMETARRRGPLPILPPSGFSIHQELLPVPSFWTRMKRVCRDRLCRIEFCRRIKTESRRERKTKMTEEEQERGRDGGGGNERNRWQVYEGEME